MILGKFLNIKKGDVISIVGAGGKTTFMFTLAEELRQNFKVLVTTSTKIYKPEREEYDFLFTTKEDFFKTKDMKENGVYVLTEGINEDNKLKGISQESIDQLKEYFDFIIIEADGSKRKPIKGWNDNEPVVFKATTKTIGIVDITVLNKTVSEDIVHRMKEFENITQLVQGDKISEEALIKIIFNEKGLFKNSVGKKILFINKAEGEKYNTLAGKLLKNIEENTYEFKLNNSLIGSLKNKTYVAYRKI